MPSTPWPTTSAVRSPRPLARRLRRAGLGAVVSALLLSGCTGDPGQGSDVDPEQVDAVETPELGACRVLQPDDVALPANATRTVDCSEEHTAETYRIGNLPEGLQDVDYDSAELGAWAFETCSSAFEEFLGADESLVLRSMVSWAWFRPSQEAWDEGARWFRCDIVGGGDNSEEYVPLPETAKGLLFNGPVDEWMVCATGAEFEGSTRVACSEPHDWRAVTSVVLGDADDPYPGDRVARVRSRDFCSESVRAWLGYPLDYDYAYTWFGEGQWTAGNRRSVCWAKTAQ